MKNYNCFEHITPAFEITGEIGEYLGTLVIQDNSLRINTVKSGTIIIDYEFPEEHIQEHILEILERKI